MQSLKIENFKNLRNLSIDSLSQVNLIVGNNNVGKSTLLEAIMITALDGDISSINKVLEIRDELYDSSSMDFDLNKQVQSLLSLFTKRSFEGMLTEGFHLKYKKEESTVAINIKIIRYIDIKSDFEERVFKREVLDVSDPRINDPEVEYGLQISYNKGSSTNTVIDPLRRISRQRLSPSGKNTVEYINTAEISRNTNPALFDKIALTDLEPEIIKTLNIIDPQINDINFLSDDISYRRQRADQRIPFVTYKQSQQRYRLSSMGDGINRILTIILALLNAKDGFLLIDEFDNGLHHSVQTQLWEIVYKLSVDLNVQVFATTHSNDCIKSFVKADSENIGKLIRLEEVEGEITAITFDNQEKLQYAIDQNIEIR